MSAPLKPVPDDWRIMQFRVAQLEQMVKALASDAFRTITVLPEPHYPNGCPVLPEGPQRDDL